MGTGLNDLGVSVILGFPGGPQLWREVCRGHTSSAGCDSSCSVYLEEGRDKAGDCTCCGPL